MSSVTKNSIARDIYFEVGVPVSIAEKLVDRLFEEITISVVEKGVAKLSSFGSFYQKSKESRVGRNLNTKQEVMIPSRRVVNFRASGKLRELVNDKKKS